MPRRGASPALLIGREERAGFGRARAGASLPARSASDGEGKEGCHEEDTGEGEEEVGLDAIETGGAVAARDELAIGVHHLIRTLPLRTEGGRSDRYLDDGSLHGALGHAVAIAGVGVVRMELPALVDEIIFVHTVIADQVAILVRGIVDAQGAVTVGVVNLVQVGEGVLLGCVEVVAIEVAAVVVAAVPVFKLALFVDLFESTAAVVVLTGQITLLVRASGLLQGTAAAAAQVVEGNVGDGVEAGAVLEGGHLEGPALQGEDSAVVVAHLAAVGVGHVGQAAEGGGVLVVVDGPKMLGDLLDKLVKLLAVDADELPLGVGTVAV